MSVRLAAAFFSGLVLSIAASAAGTADPFAGTWEARVATGLDTYTLRLTCRSQADCELQRSDTSKGAKPTAETIAFRGTRPAPALVEPMAKALRYAIEHRAESKANVEFVAVQKLLAKSVDAKTEVESCIAMDEKQPDFFVACTVRGATSKQPVLLFYGSLLGLCGQGFCKHVIYPLVKAGADK